MFYKVLTIFPRTPTKDKRVLYDRNLHSFVHIAHKPLTNQMAVGWTDRKYIAIKQDVIYGNESGVLIHANHFRR